jgi:acyl dehydratase
MDRYVEDYEIGSTRRTLGRTVTETDIVLHAGQTGDFYPHHMDAHWAATQPFKRRIAHGTLILSIAVGMTAGDVNSLSLSYGYDRIRFIRPVFIGDTIRVSAEVIAIREPRKNADQSALIDELVTVENQDGEVVLVLTHVYLVERRVPHATSGDASPADA